MRSPKYYCRWYYRRSCGIAGGIAGFLESSVSQIWNKEKYSLRKALGAAAKGAITGAAQGALMASGAGLAKTGAKLATSLLTNFGAGFLGSMAEQKINKRRVNPREAIREGLNNSISGALFGNSPISGLKNAIIRGARSNAAVAAINNILIPSLQRSKIESMTLCEIFRREQRWY